MAEVQGRVGPACPRPRTFMCRGRYLPTIVKYRGDSRECGRPDPRDADMPAKWIEYSAAPATLAAVVREPRDRSTFPSAASLTAMYAVSLTKSARDLGSDPARKPEATEILSKAKDALENTLAQNRSVLNPVTTRALRWHLGIVEFYRGFDESSFDCLRAVTLINDADPVIIARAENAIGYLKLVNGRLDEANRSYVKAISLAPDLAVARVNRAYVLLIDGKYAEAIEYLRSLLDGPDALPAPRDKLSARLAIGLAFDMEGSREKATREYDAVLKGVKRDRFSRGPGFA